MFKEVLGNFIKILHTFNVQGCYKTDTQKRIKENC